MYERRDERRGMPHGGSSAPRFPGKSGNRLDLQGRRMGIDRTIRRLRQRANLSQKDVARALGVGQSAVSHGENGTVRPSLAKIPKLAAVLGVSKQELFADADADRASEDERPPQPDAYPGEHPSDDPRPVSPYMRSLEQAVMRSRPSEALELTVPLVTLGRGDADEPAEEELMGCAVEVPASVLRNHPSAEALVVRGDCINRVAGNGAIVVFDPSTQPTDGRIAIVETENRTVVIRRWHRGTDKVMLTADSYQHYPDIVLERNSPLRVLGTVVHVVTPQDML